MLTTSIAISKHCALHSKIVGTSMKMRPQNACITCAIDFFHTQLTQSEVDSYCDSIPPSCQLELHFQRTSQPYERLSRQIKVSGIQGISSITVARDIDPGKIKAIVMKHACAVNPIKTNDSARLSACFCIHFVYVISHHVICN